MKKGDKFIVVKDITEEEIHHHFEKGEIVTYVKRFSTDTYIFKSSSGKKQALRLSQIKPLDIMPCDDEQANYNSYLG